MSAPNVSTPLMVSMDVGLLYAILFYAVYTPIIYVLSSAAVPDTL